VNCDVTRLKVSLIRPYLGLRLCGIGRLVGLADRKRSLFFGGLPPSLPLAREAAALQLQARALLQKGWSAEAIAILEQSGTPSKAQLGYAYAVNGAPRRGRGVACGERRLSFSTGLDLRGSGRQGSSLRGAGRHGRREGPTRPTLPRLSRNALDPWRPPPGRFPQKAGPSMTLQKYTLKFGQGGVIGLCEVALIESGAQRKPAKEDSPSKMPLIWKLHGPSLQRHVPAQLCSFL
jgi:hypothetical protein